MKKLILLTALTLTAPAYADDNAHVMEMCINVKEAATTMMKSRQVGMELDKVLAYGDVDLFQTMAIEAYKQPRFSTDQYQQRAISEFSNEWYLACLTAHGVK